ncbi:MAG: helix-turn-helix domain-containing protein [Bacteriovoracaceae bacterium]|jgi:excisionase family DNA binding protein|nr:helix-turn-helix domain-containing protein [Bacteriovoracaceae bacterium]|tara:strand:- start:43 stop:228 length:186 start_codon:yes stop_codon:yes gene_type:complete
MLASYKSDLMTIKETQDYLNLKESKLRSMIFKDEIPYLKIGRLIRFRKEKLDEWLTSLDQH